MQRQATGTLSTLVPSKSLPDQLFIRSTQQKTVRLSWVGHKLKWEMKNTRTCSFTLLFLTQKSRHIIPNKLTRYFSNSNVFCLFFTYYDDVSSGARDSTQRMTVSKAKLPASPWGAQYYWPGNECSNVGQRQVGVIATQSMSLLLAHCQRPPEHHPCTASNSPDAWPHAYRSSPQNCDAQFLTVELFE